MSESQKKIIAIKDYLQQKPEPVDVELDDCVVQVILESPSPEDVVTLMQMVSIKNPRGDAATAKDFDKYTPEERAEVFRLGYEYDAALVSSCAKDPADGKKIWPTMEDAMKSPHVQLFEKLRPLVQKFRIVMGEGEAKK